MSLSTKILLALGAALFCVLAFFLVYNQIQTTKQLNAMQQSIVEQKQLLDNISRGQAQFVSKDDITAFAKQQDINLAVIQKDLDNLDAQIKAIGAITIISTGQVDTNVKSTNTTPAPPDVPKPAPGTDPYGYLSNAQSLDLNETFSNTKIPFGKVTFSAWRDKPWDINIAERKYSVTSVLGQDQAGKYYSYSKFAIQTGGKTYDVKIDDNKYLTEYPSSKFSFNLKPYMFINGGAGVSTTPIKGEVTPGVAVSLFSYGKNTTNPDLSIAQIGVGYGISNKTAELSISPIQYNLGQNISFISNTYVGPVIQGNSQGNITLGGGLSVGF